MDHLAYMASQEDNLDYENVEEIVYHNILINKYSAEGTNKVVKKLLIQKLHVLNTPDDDPDQNTVFVRKVVLTPELSRDQTIKKLKKALYRKTAKEFNSQLDEITKMLNSLVIPGEEPSKKVKVISSRIQDLKIVHQNYTIAAIKKEAEDFKKQLRSMISNTNSISMIEKSKKKDLMRMQDEVKSLKSKFKLLSQQIETNSSSLDLQKLHNALEDLFLQINKLTLKIKSLKQENISLASKIINKTNQIKKMVTEHKSKLEQAIELGSVGEREKRILGVEGFKKGTYSISN